MTPEERLQWLNSPLPDSVPRWRCPVHHEAVERHRRWHALRLKGLTAREIAAIDGVTFGAVQRGVKKLVDRGLAPPIPDGRKKR